VHDVRHGHREPAPVEGRDLDGAAGEGAGEGEGGGVAGGVAVAVAVAVVGWQWQCG
jgi:hypothetical protein